MHPRLIKLLLSSASPIIIEMEIAYFRFHDAVDFHVAPCIELFLCKSETIGNFHAEKDTWNQLNISVSCSILNAANPANEARDVNFY